MFEEFENLYFDFRVCCGLVDSSVLMQLSSKQKNLFGNQGASFLDDLANSLQFKYSHALRNGHFDVINALVTTEVRNKITKLSTN